MMHYRTHRIASPNASAESFSFIASSIAFLALPSLAFPLDFFFLFFFLLLSELAPPRRLSHKNGSDNRPFLDVVASGDTIVVVALDVIPIANCVYKEQTIARDNSVLIVRDECDIIIFVCSWVESIGRVGIARKWLLMEFDDGIEADANFCIAIVDVVELWVEVPPCSNEKINIVDVELFLV
jgi:hypothetical protein